MSHYILEFSDIKGGKKTSKDFSISSSSAADPAKHLNVPNTDVNGLKNIIFQLKDLKFEKGLYAPCSVEAVVNVSNFTDTANINLLTGLFHERTVTLKCAHGIDGYDAAPVVVGSDYFVYKARPSVKFGTGGVAGCTVTLEIFSRDHLLTIPKYSRAYTSRKFGADIIKATLSPSSSAQGAPKNGEHILSDCLVDVNVDVDRLQCTKVDGKELIQPYHVQMNEDFYSFISRIAARHGEFLFFEDGKLTLGIKPSATPTSLEAVNIVGQTRPVNVVLSMEQTDTMTNVPEVNPLYSNYLFRNGAENDKIHESRNKAAGQPQPADGAKLYLNQDCYDEYFDILDVSDDALPDTFGKEQTWGFYIIAFLTQLLPMISAYRHDGSFLGTEKLLELATAVGIQEAKLVALVDQVNKQFKKRVNIPVPYSSEQISKNLKSQFASFTDITNKSNFMKEFFWIVREGERVSSGNTITMKVRPGMKKLNVGDVVQLSKTKYMVTRVSGNFSISDTLVDTCTVEALPFVDGDIMYPPYNKCSEFAPAGPQVAIVSSSDDPRYLNRVRVKYPWQSKDEPASPWVRVSTPYATATGAINFRMNPGDEVMLDYIDGNMDRPYVVGALQNANTITDKLQFKYGDCEIRSQSGARLKLDYANIFNFVGDYIPAWGTILSPWMAPIFTKLMKAMGQGKGYGNMAASFASKATLTDSYGFYEISGDSSKRSVTINSSIGNVTVSALTGITVSAPLGDVVIEGKNITLKAGNNITLESGLNIKSDLDKEEAFRRVARMHEGHGTFASGLISTASFISKNVSDLLSKSIDMSLIRLIYDIVNTPKEGTLKMKSYRYVAVEAGDGDVKDLPGCYYPKGSLSYDTFNKIQSLSTQLADISLKKRLETLVNECASYSAAIQPYSHWSRDAQFYEDGAPAGEGIINSSEILDLVMAPDYQTVPKDKRWINGGVFIHPVNECKKNEVLRASDALIKCALSFKKYVNTPIESSKSCKKLYEELPSSVADKVIEAFKEIIAQYKSGEKIGQVADLANRDERYQSLVKGLFRLSVAKCLNLPGSGIKWRENSIALVQDNDMFPTDEWWEQMIGAVEIDDQAGKVAPRTGLSAAVLDNLEKIGDAYAKYKTPAGLWREGQSGKVLISAAKGRTFMVDNSSDEWISKEDVTATGESLTAFLRTK